MKPVVFFISFVAISLLLTLAGYTTYHLYNLTKFIIQGAKTLSPQVYVPLTVTVLTAALGLAAALFTQRSIRLREIESSHRERKLEIYLDFLKFYESALISEKPELEGETFDEKEVAKKLIEFRTKAVLWGSPGVLRQVSLLTKLDGAGPTVIFSVLENIQREMRKDIGLSNWGLEKDFFAKLPLRNPEDLDKLREK
ncbi:MAG: hypothetical protein QNJ09_04920 [Paracoccaceae bacterium]|nr:hypothetical protein [Paracoccaceae bacterium]